MTTRPDGACAVLVGRRRSVLDPLAAALVERGMVAVVLDAADLRGADAREVLGDRRVDVVALGRAVDEAMGRQVLDAARSRNPRAQRVDGLLPITELLVDQVELGARRAAAVTDGDAAVVVQAVPWPAVIVRTPSDDVHVVRYRMGALGRRSVQQVEHERLGTDVVASFASRPGARRDVVSVRVDGACTFVGASLGRLPQCA